MPKNKKVTNLLLVFSCKIVTHLNVASNFSLVPWGTTLSGNIKRANPLFACEAVTIDNYNQSSSTILFAQRGGDCSFVTKAFYAQLAGADMLIIANNVPGETVYSILIDDGTNREINIPVALISFEEALTIQDYLDLEDMDNGTSINQIWASVTFEFQRTIDNGNTTELDL